MREGCWLTDWVMDWLSKPVEWLIYCLSNGLIEWLIDWFVNVWLINSMHNLVPRPSHPNFCHLQHYRMQQTRVRRPEYEPIGCILAAQNCGRNAGEGSQPVGGSFSHIPSQQPVREGEPEYQILHWLSQWPAKEEGGRGGSLDKMLQTSSSVWLLEGGIDDVAVVVLGEMSGTSADRSMPARGSSNYFSMYVIVLLLMLATPTSALGST